MPLAAVDLLAPVGAALLAALGRLDRLAVDGGGAGGRLTPGLGTDLRAEGIQDLLPGAVPRPPLEVVVDRPPRGEVMRQGPPTAPFAGVIEQGVDDLAQVGLAGPTPPAGARQQWFEQGPLLVSQVTGIGFAFHTSFYANPHLWNRL